MFPGAGPSSQARLNHRGGWVPGSRITSSSRLHEVQSPLCVERRHLPLKLVWAPFVVLVEQRDQLAACRFDSVVACGPNPGVGLPQHTHSEPVQVRQL